MLRKPLSEEAAEQPRCRAERFEIVGRLTGGIVHDFNNVLTVITGLSRFSAKPWPTGRNSPPLPDWSPRPPPAVPT